jgi:TRAP-type mannitol/chloroaromatic compound transport system permease large subunit
VTTGQIYRGVVPFVALQLTAILLIIAVPALATWLPRWIYP